MSLVEIISIILPVTMTIFILALAWGENPLYETGSYLLIGSSMGWTFVYNITFLRKTAWMNMVTGKPHYIIAIILGFMLFARWSRTHIWIYRYAMAVFIGTGAGLGVRGTVTTTIIKHVTATFLPLMSGDALTIISNWLIVLGVITTVSYFLFAQRLKLGPMEVSNKIGRYFIMAALGARFGSVMTFRINVLIGRIEFLLKPDHWQYSAVIAILSLVFLVGYDRLKGRPPKTNLPQEKTL